MTKQDCPTRREIEQKLRELKVELGGAALGSMGAKSSSPAARFLPMHDVHHLLFLAVARPFVEMFVRKAVSHLAVRGGDEFPDCWVFYGSVKELHPCILCIAFANGPGHATTLDVTVYTLETLIRGRFAEIYYAAFLAALKQEAGIYSVTPEQTEGGGADAGA